MTRHILQPLDVQTATPLPTPKRRGHFIVISFIAGTCVGAAPSILGSDRIKSMAVDVVTYPLTLFVPAVPVRLVAPMTSSVRANDRFRHVSTAVSMQDEDTPAKGDASEEWKPEAEVERAMGKIPGKFKEAAPAGFEGQARGRLAELATQWKGARLAKPYEFTRGFGFTTSSEVFNGRIAMFFFAVGLYTEVVTGETMSEVIQDIFDVFSVGL
eukprot:CAMPEP_0179260196 /NCGR_PEP_ID=MMETSP0797-20121207/26215_1 /TAXON_ID=47934 /ORGANISM="Dinophysis acuminata, Strain DAEP01" /LENGTH=212 /DNA_ID=CAMNT_0020968269 /DNA_START=42 /DNA_END=680 /DNA_ORIENTATION=-